MAMAQAGQDQRALLRLTGEAAAAAGDLLDHATTAVRALVTRDGASEAALLTREQHAVHGLAWLATYAQALRQMQAWAARLDDAGAFGALERALLAAAFGEYLARIQGGMPMSQGEIARLTALGVDDAAIARS